MSEWIRHGECNGCGRCCEVLLHPAMARIKVAVTDPAYLAARGLTPDREGFVQVIGDLVAPCPQLTPEKRCGLHDTKPEYCRDYPTRPEQIASFPCSYYFTRGTEVWGGLASPHPGRQEMHRG